MPFCWGPWLFLITEELVPTNKGWTISPTLSKKKGRKHVLSWLKSCFVVDFGCFFVVFGWFCFPPCWIFDQPGLDQLLGHGAPIGGGGGARNAPEGRRDMDVGPPVEGCESQKHTKTLVFVDTKIMGHLLGQAFDKKSTWILDFSRTMTLYSIGLSSRESPCSVKLSYRWADNSKVNVIKTQSCCSNHISLVRNTKPDVTALNVCQIMLLFCLSSSTFPREHGLHISSGQAAKLFFQSDSHTAPWIQELKCFRCVL